MIKFFTKVSLTLIIIFVVKSSYGRDFIRITGSSTVYPFASLISEKFSRVSQHHSPVVEANGTGGGFFQFCKGIGFAFPDINNASRKITDKELALCNQNGIREPLSIKIGYDGITLIYPKTLGKINLTNKEIFLALSNKVPSKENPNVWVTNFYKTWNDIDPKLPKIPIRVMGPPNTSGTRDTFVEIILNNTCKVLTKNLSQIENSHSFCGNIRKDNAWQDGSENYNLVIQKVKNSDHLFAIIGYNYYQLNTNAVSVASINGVVPNKKSITEGKYDLSRPLYMYVKKEHLNAVPGLTDFVKFIVSNEILGDSGFLVTRGLIPIRNEEFTKISNYIIKSLN